jgi:hypothetical protein
MNKSNSRVAAVTAICLILTTQTIASSPDGKISLSDGKTLAGWHTAGEGTWTVEDGAFVGRADRTKLYGLLVSNKTFSDFTVSFRFKCISGDSGFYIRTLIENPEKGKGMQVQVGPVGSGNGGIYESYGRGWLARPSAELEKKIVKADDWNRMTITANGAAITVHVNGTKTAELKKDTGRAAGHFALQMHAGQKVHVIFTDIAIKELPQ